MYRATSRLTNIYLPQITLANSKNSLLASSMDQLKNFCIQSMGNKKPPISEDSSSVTKVYYIKL